MKAHIYAEQGHSACRANDAIPQLEQLVALLAQLVTALLGAAVEPASVAALWTASVAGTASAPMTSTATSSSAYRNKEPSLQGPLQV